jgi:hypothetical protein
MRIFVKSLLILLSLLTGATFLYSAWTKVLPIQPFEYTMVEYLHFPWLLAAIAARFMVGLEAALGGLMVLHLYGRGKLVLKAAFLLLIVFSIYLVWLWATAGNNINCGCFGDEIWMSPSVSLVKNAVLLAIIGVLLRFHNGLVFRWHNKITIALLCATTILPFILYPITIGAPSWVKKGGYKIDFAPLYHPIVDDSDAIKVPYPQTPDKDLSKGSYIIAFLSPSCEHCRIAARKMSLMKRDNPAIPFFIIIGGIASDLSDFWKTTKAEHIPWMRLHRDPFLNYTGGMFPLIIWVNNGTVEAKSTYNTLNQNEIEKWLAKTHK